jgi:hypothetical protein
MPRSRLLVLIAGNFVATTFISVSGLLNKLQQH